MDNQQIEKRVESLEQLLLSLSESYIATTKVLIQHSTISTQIKDKINQSITEIADAVVVSIIKKK